MTGGGSPKTRQAATVRSPRWRTTPGALAGRGGTGGPRSIQPTAVGRSLLTNVNPVPRSRSLIAGLAAVTAILLLASAGAAAAATGPTLMTRPADQVTDSSATLRGVVDTVGEPTTFFFQYGTTLDYESQSAPGSLVAGATTVAVSRTIIGLSAATVYHYRLVAVNAAGTTFGADLTLRTAPTPLSLAIAAPNTVTFGDPLAITGTLAGTGAAGSVVVLQQNPYPFTTGFEELGSPGVIPPSAAFALDAGTPAVTTQYRVVTVGPGDPVVSGTLTVFVGLALTLTETSHKARDDTYDVHFAGLIRPTDDDARVSLQELIHGRWKFVSATRSRRAASAQSRYAITLRLRHGGYFRVFAASIDGGHIASFSQPQLVHARPGYSPQG
jgi:hypothetical protein